MNNDDLKKLRESKEKIFAGIMEILGGVGLGHLQVAGLELEPSSFDKDSSFISGGGDRTLETIANVMDCEGRLVLRVNPKTGASYWVCISDDHEVV